MTSTSDSAILDIRDLTLSFGSLTAVDAVTLRVYPGARHALIGPNGAGKSTLFGVIAGRLRPTSGKVFFNGQDVTGLREAGRARAGLLRTFQHSSLFLAMSVLDNVRLAVERATGQPRRPWPNPFADLAVTEAAMTHLETVGLAYRSASLCGVLSHGERRQVEVAMVLACNPRMVLFDEPTAGMSVAETNRFAEIVESLPREVTVVVVEHDLDIVFRLAERVSVLAAGRLIADGTPEQVRADDGVQEAYLGRNSRTALFGAAS
ncbi:ABC transporter ATP-binding protein [Pseudarthrobacter sp. WHRI 8279]|uniref:ABC transporter ATP-binding protein n=1 Tax=Pseudarthrobacter sp. WHRI 8279 TaxID=3162566 RepID=UPI0032EB4476